MLQGNSWLDLYPRKLKFNCFSLFYLKSNNVARFIYIYKYICVCIYKIQSEISTTDWAILSHFQFVYIPVLIRDCKGTTSHITNLKYWSRLPREGGF